MTEASHAEFARFVREAREQRERAEHLEGENARLRDALVMCDYVAMTIHEASSEEGTIDRARDVRRRIADVLGPPPYHLSHPRPGGESDHG